MTKFAPALGLILASPVVVDALRGRRGIDEALTALLIGVLTAAVALWVLGLAARASPPPTAVTANSETGADSGPPVGYPSDTGPSTVS